MLFLNILMLLIRRGLNLSITLVVILMIIVLIITLHWDLIIGLYLRRCWVAPLDILYIIHLRLLDILNIRWLRLLKILNNLWRTL